MQKDKHNRYLSDQELDAIESLPGLVEQCLLPLC
jgi:hypothetical protein